MSQRRSSVVLELVNKIGGPMRRIRRQVRSATADLRASFARVGRAGRGLALGIGTAAAGLGAALTKITFDTAKQGDSVAKLADQLGLTTDALQEYGYVADRQGVPQKTLNASLLAFSKRLGEARNGSGALSSYLKKANPELLKQLLATEDLESAFNLYLRAMEATNDETVKAAGASAAFSRSGVAMVRIVRDGWSNVEQLRKQAHRLGLVLSEDAARSAEGFQDSLTNVQGAVQGVKTILGAALMPAIQNIMDRITRLVIENREQIGQWSQQFARELPARIERTVTAFRDTVQAIRNIVDMIGGWKVAMAGIMTVLAGPFLLAVGGAMVAIAKLGGAIAKTKAARKLFGKAFAVDPLGRALGRGRWSKWLNRAGAVAAAGAVGWLIGSEINKRIEKAGLGETVSNAVGRSVDKVLAAFGNDDAQRRLDSTPQGQARQSRERADDVDSQLAARQREELRKYRTGKPSAYDHIPLPTGVARHERRADTAADPDRAGRYSSGGGGSEAAAQPPQGSPPRVIERRQTTTQRTEVGGVLEIRIASDGQPRVQRVERNGPMDIDIDAAPLMLRGG